MGDELLTVALGGGVIVFVAATSQAVSGFGFALVAVPLLALLIDPVTAVVATTMLSAAVSARGWSLERSWVDGRISRRLVVTGMLGMPVGLWALTALEPRLLGGLIAVTVLAMTALVANGLRVAGGRGPQYVAGGLSGALLASTGMNGPPLVLVLQPREPKASGPASELANRRFRATLQAVFCCQDVLVVVGFLVVGAISTEALTVFLLGVLVVPLGWAAGDWVFHRLSPVIFRRAVLCGLLACGISAGAGALLGHGH